MMREKFHHIINKLSKHDFHSRYNSYLKELEKAIADSDSLLDLGCGPRSPMSEMKWKYSVGVEGYSRDAEKAKKSATHSKIVVKDLRKIDTLFAPASFDAVVALDVIEHFEKDDGYRLIRNMEQLAKKVVVISTPNGFLSQTSTDNSLQEHLSGWDCEEMISLGYQVVGLFGPKFLRGEYHLPKYRPILLCGLLTEVADLVFTRRFPNYAAAILCIKFMDSD